VSEVELELRKKETSLSEEEGKTMEKTGQLFENLVSLAKGVKPLTILSEDEYEELVDHEVGGFLTVKMGADAVLLAIDKINLDETSVQLAKELEESKVGSSKYIKVSKRLKLINGLRRAKINPSSMILKVLPVLPPDLRPMVQLSGGRFATSDLNDLYRRVINRNNRLKHLIGLGAPEIILRNEKRMLQEAVDSLIDASQRKATRKGRGKQPLRSLSDMLRGKQGRFRQNLLGKRVDYSGRSVIVVGPELKLTQCGLPKEMALEMFKPFVLREMIVRGIAPNVKSAKNMLDRRPAEVFDILEEIIKDHPVLLNRAPTLHKLSIQAFYPVLIEGNAIRLHPAVCSGFNADFDGDQMAVHVPLSKKAIEEAKTLMLPTSNLLKPSDGSPATTPATKEIALGIYFLTSIDAKIKASTCLFGDKNEAIFACQSEKIELKQLITVKTENGFIDTTYGRILFNEALPSGFDFVNEAVTSIIIKQLLTKAFNTHTGEEVAEMIDAIKDLGFWAGTLSGLSFGISDAKVLPQKEAMLNEAEKEVSKIEENFAQGLITAEEKRRLTQEVWINVSEELVDKTWDALDEDNPIKIVINAKVGRTSKDQVKQLAAMRGLIVDPVGKIVELPIKSNFREGLSEFEYVTSSRGSRKGLTDTAIKTADAGYLTRRLVDVAHDVIVRDEDCGTKEKYVVRRNPRANVFFTRILGRYLAEDIVDTKSKVMFKKGELLDELKAKEVDANPNVNEVFIRSPLTCSLRHGICVKCYGWDFSNKKVVARGTPVGVIAAESIGEPGTQLTLKTKHTGGIVGVDITQGLPRVEELFEARTPKILSPLSEISGKIKISETNEGWKVVVNSKEAKLKDEREYIIPKSIKLAIKDGDFIESGSPLAAGSLDIKEILLIKGLLTAQEYIVSEIQKVYESQGIPINDKHFEVIVRKMSDDVKVATSGDTAFLPGEIINKAGFEEENEKILAAGGEPASAQQVILGITRRALFVESWLSAASFEQTTDILTEASLLGKEDRLLGLKENVIIGRLVPVLPERFI